MKSLTKYGAGRSKFGAIKTEVDGIVFDSKKESVRYSELKLLQRAGKIDLLVIQPKFPITINGKKVCTYVADFEYYTPTGDGSSVFKKVVEDVKGMKTPMYRLKKKLTEAQYGIEIQEL